MPPTPGYCPYGTGVRATVGAGRAAVRQGTDPEVGPRPQVYSCAPKGNPNYTFRESIPLGVTSISAPQVRLSSVVTHYARPVTHPVAALSVPAVH